MNCKRFQLWYGDSRGLTEDFEIFMLGICWVKQIIGQLMIIQVHLQGLTFTSCKRAPIFSLCICQTAGVSPIELCSPKSKTWTAREITWNFDIYIYLPKYLPGSHDVIPVTFDNEFWGGPMGLPNECTHKTMSFYREFGKFLGLKPATYLDSLFVLFRYIRIKQWGTLVVIGLIF